MQKTEKVGGRGEPENEKDSESQKEGTEMRSYGRKRTESREMQNKGEIRFGDAFDFFSV
jgi:hypothetical protein